MTLRRPRRRTPPTPPAGEAALWSCPQLNSAFSWETFLMSPRTRHACFLPGVAGAEHPLGGSAFPGPAAGSQSDGLHTRVSRIN